MKKVVSGKMTRRDFAVWVGYSGFGIAALSVAGCGGGGGTSSTRSTPTAVTKSRVLTMHDLAVRGVMQSGFQTPHMAFAHNGFHGGGGMGNSSGGGIAIDGGAPPPSPQQIPPSSASAGHTMPLIGAFLRNVASAPPQPRAASITRMTRMTVSSDGMTLPPGPPPDDLPPYPDPDPAPTFYFDYYLGLWVEISETANTSTYSLYENEDKTNPAGKIITTNPVDWETYPQVYASRYEFTAGYLAGSHGFSENVTNADYSGRSAYENVYADGWKDKGKSSWSGRGDFTWTSRTEGANGEWDAATGSFRADGGGGTRYSSSSGYVANYVYNADGSGRGQITGPDPGMPVAISWDAYGNTLIVYADGSTERIAGWGSYYRGGGGGSGPVPVDLPPGEPVQTQPAPAAIKG